MTIHGDYDHHGEKIVARKKLTNFVVPVEALNAAQRILDSTTYGDLRIAGDKKQYEQFYKDVQLLARTVARLVTEGK